jgi:hypothetical protein
MRPSSLYREMRVPDVVFALICHTIQDLSKPLENYQVLGQWMPNEASVDFLDRVWLAVFTPRAYSCEDDKITKTRRSSGK